MAEMEFFPQRPDSHPMIYAYEDTNPQYKGLLKVGYTSIDVDKRVAQQYPTKRPDGSVPYRIVLRESAMYPDGTSFTDHDVHRVLRKKQITGMGGEWFKCTVNDVKAAIAAVRTGTANVENRTQTFAMRPEQEYAVDMTMKYFKSAYEEGSGRTPKFLWNAKMRFGKTFAAYQLAKKMGMKRVLILTFKPAVQTAWREDLLTHMDFEGWQFITRPTVPGGLTNDQQYQRADKSRPIICFGSFQDFLGVNKETGGIKANNEWVHTTNWDLVIFDLWRHSRGCRRSSTNATKTWNRRWRVQPVVLPKRKRSMLLLCPQRRCSPRFRRQRVARMWKSRKRKRRRRWLR